MECPICFENKELVCLQPCRHKFCKECAIQSLIRYNIKCSLCKQSVCGIEGDDKEADIIMKLGFGKHAGVTLTNHANGVRVLRTIPQDESYKTLSKKDVIIELNGIPAVNHRDAVTIIDTATIHAIPLRILLYKPKTPTEYDVHKMRRLSNAN